MCVGKPEKVRTGFCFLERKMALYKWRKTEPVVFSGLLIFGYFLLEEQKKLTKKEEGALLRHPINRRGEPT
jgi:hypothetical protein